VAAVRPRARTTWWHARLDNETLAAVDTLVEAGVRATAPMPPPGDRVGSRRNRDLLDDIAGTVTEIRRLREDAAGKGASARQKKSNKPIRWSLSESIRTTGMPGW